MRLSSYLPTGTFELTVHGADLASALGVPLDPPPAAAMQSLQIIGELAVLDGLAAPLLLAATGRSRPERHRDFDGSGTVQGARFAGRRVPLTRGGAGSSLKVGRVGPKSAARFT